SRPIVRFSPDGNTLATIRHGRATSTVKLWQLDGKLIKTLEGWDAQFSPYGDTFVIDSRDGTIQLWPWNINELTSYACQKVREYLQNSPDVEKDDEALCR
ncbi:MAG: hypothetical protein AAGL17_22385, partial [Cyanobacteria bacterium J06576_12]